MTIDGRLFNRCGDCGLIRLTSHYGERGWLCDECSARPPERVGRGICDGCGGEGELTAFDAAQVACGICICDDCLAKNAA